MNELMTSLFKLDIKTIIALLFMGNLFQFALIYMYQISSDTLDNKKILDKLYRAKILQAVGWILIFYRGMIPDIISVVLGNAVLYSGIYLESLAMLDMASCDTKVPYYIQTIIFSVGIAAFTISEIMYKSPEIRIEVASLVVFSIFIMPTIRFITASGGSLFRKSFGIYYVALVILMPIRSLSAIGSDTTNVFSNNGIQSAVFMVMMLIMTAGTTGSLLLIKEENDRRIAELAATDPLTGLYNRRSFMKQSYQIFDEHKRMEDEFSIIFIDIDHFKKINDNYGHQFGDDVLVKLSELIRSSTRTYDVACRYGGEEFLVVMPHTAKDGARIVSERILENARKIEFKSNAEFAFTVSIGLYTGVPHVGDRLEDYIERSDTALYKSKETGRDKIVEY